MRSSVYRSVLYKIYKISEVDLSKVYEKTNLHNKWRQISK